MRVYKHFVKTWPKYFEMAWLGLKPFEVRINDRDYRVGDILILEEYNPDRESFSGRLIEALIISMVEGVFGLPDNVCVMGIKILSRRLSPHGDWETDV